MTSNQIESEGRVDGEAGARLERAPAPESSKEAREIVFFVDGERETTEQKKWTPNEIIRQFTSLDPSTTYLTKISKHQNESYRDKGDTPIIVHEGDQFQTVSLGPTPVSDLTTRTGVDAFAAGLEALGFSVKRNGTRNDIVTFDYNVLGGSQAGRVVRLGFLIPSDFPNSPPSGPHISPHIHPINANGEHPKRVHPSELQAVEPGEWQYWSRPFPDWGKSKRTVAAYMQHIFRLWSSQ